MMFYKGQFPDHITELKRQRRIFRRSRQLEFRRQSSKKGDRKRVASKIVTGSFESLMVRMEALRGWESCATWELGTHLWVETCAVSSSHS